MPRTMRVKVCVFIVPGRDVHIHQLPNTDYSRDLIGSLCLFVTESYAVLLFVRKSQHEFSFFFKYYSKSITAMTVFYASFCFI